MSKNKPDQQIPPKHIPTLSEAVSGGSPDFEKTLAFIREIVETFAIAFILAFLFRTFEGELYGIPTGSMAPTLMGRHKDFCCPECGYQYQVSASEEFNANENRATNKSVIGGTCPQCRYTAYIGADNPQKKKYSSYRGDNILVNKYALNFRNPQRWKPTVFRYPGSPQVNYIKRVVGLENETIQLHNGNIYVQKADDQDFHIARKDSRQLLSMLQMVHCNDFMPQKHIDAGFPARWHTDSQLTIQQPQQHGTQTVDILHQNNIPQTASGGWQTKDHVSFQSAPTQEFSWLNYRHCIPVTEDWNQYKLGTFAQSRRVIPPQLITDFTAYNTSISLNAESPGFDDHVRYIMRREVLQGNERVTELACTPKGYSLGVNWVRDLAVECELTSKKPQGDVLLELVGGGVAFDCLLNLENGTATFSIPGRTEFQPTTVNTPIKGTGTWRALFANIDDELRLFVNSKEIELPEHSGSYNLPAERDPTFRDLTPAAIGVRNAEVEVKRLTIKRDIYYIATNGKNHREIDRVVRNLSIGNEQELRELMSNSAKWEHFGETSVVEWTLGKGQYFAMGDNTAQSQDSRLWMNGSPPSPTVYVPQKNLVGEAIFVHWPHGNPIPGTEINVIPNVGKIRFIH
ncbi:MAG: S26 family signal peptidase [Planctomycetaceae bacterium]|nr:S26 family signal peptidase [Planctomycetaceae bacterium]